MHLIRGLGQPVMREVRVPLRGDQPGLAEICQVSGYRRLRDVEDFDEVADAHLGHDQQVQKPNPRRISEAAENRVELVEPWDTQPFGNCRSRQPSPQCIRLAE